jgi:hypothetical protein
VFNHKRALALVLGLFLYLSLLCPFPLGADGDFSLLSGAGPLWVEDGGTAFYWQSGLSFNDSEGFYTDLALGQVVSTLPWVEGSVLGGRGKFGFALPRFGIAVNYGFFQHDLISSKTESFHIYNDGGQGFFAETGAGLSIGGWNVASSFLYGSGNWDDGSFYWFFGSPGIPALIFCGLSLGYRKQHALTLCYLSVDMDIHSDTTERLFDAHLDAYAAYYRFSSEIANLRLGGTLGWLYAAAETAGALTASNQHYAYFPYNFYTLEGFFGVHAGFGAVDLRQTFSLFQYRLVIGAVHAFLGAGSADIHYREKRLFGGAEIFDTKSLDIGGTGAVFILLDAGFPALRPGRQKKALLSLGVKKLFAIPWGYEAVRPEASPSPEASASSRDSILKTALLSGLSFYASLSW